MAMHPAYQQIVGMGRSAVPFILKELANGPGHWFWALRAISGEDPVSSQGQGRRAEDDKRMACVGRSQRV